ncbi:MAG: hypothetical protein ACE5I1_06410, partial [bacterium]
MKNFSSTIFIILFLLNMVCSAQVLYGKQAHLQTIAVEEDDNQVVYHLHCSEKVQFATIYNEEVDQLRVFLHGVEMPEDVSSILNGNLRNIIEIELRKQEPPVLQVSIRFSEKLPYKVDSINATIRIVISKTIAEIPTTTIEQNQSASQ